jgi:hypothetical protein
VRPAPACFALAAVLAFTSAAADPEDGARAAAKTFGNALVAGNAAALRPILPQRGKVHVTLTRLGPEDGSFAAVQVEALFHDFFARGKVASFAVTRCESDGQRSALAHGTAAITDREGRAGRVGFHLGFQSEGDRLVLREVKETAE